MSLFLVDFLTPLCHASPFPHVVFSVSFFLFLSSYSFFMSYFLDLPFCYTWLTVHLLSKHCFSLPWSQSQTITPCKQKNNYLTDIKHNSGVCLFHFALLKNFHIVQSYPVCQTGIWRECWVNGKYILTLAPFCILYSAEHLKLKLHAHLYNICTPKRFLSFTHTYSQSDGDPGILWYVGSRSQGVIHSTRCWCSSLTHGGSECCLNRL